MPWTVKRAHKMYWTDFKSVVPSERCRLAGNKVFKERKYKQAIELYNQSLCHAPPGSECIPLAYANRSAVYFEMGKYALAIENIKLAQENGFPAKKMAKLNEREEKCEKLMEEFGVEKDSVASDFFKLSYPPNEKIPFIAGCLELRKCEKYGRGIYTTKDLRTGDIIAIERPVFSWTDPQILTQSCFVCIKTNSGSLIPCKHCTTVMYCSKECQQKKVSLHHNNNSAEPYSGEFKKSLKMQLEAFGVAGGVDELLELLKDCEGKTIYDFDFSDPEDPSYKRNMLIALNGLWRNIGNQEMIEVKPGQLLNIPPINETPRTAKKRKQLLKFIISQHKICTSNLIPVREGIHGIFLLRSLLNHSCIPNVESLKFDNDTVTMTIRPIKAGEQVFMSYFANAAVHPLLQRVKILQIFQFKCDCMACINDWPQPFPRKDSGFIEPGQVKLNPSEAIEQFKDNCKYIDKNAEKMPSFEVLKLMYHNYLLTNAIAGNKITIVK